ncbi:MAG: PAS domain S-box protein [Anaerolineae bacterium]
MIEPDGQSAVSKNLDVEPLREEVLKTINDRGILPHNKRKEIDPKSLNLKMAQCLIEELQVNQVELELQNEQLRDAKQSLELSHKKLEERQRLLQAAVEYSTDGISISDMRQHDNPIIYASPKLAEISGYSAEELEGGNWRMLYEEEPDEEARSLIREAFSLGRECRTYVRNLRKDGTPFYCEVTLYPLTDDRGIVTHYVSVIHDITEKRKTDQALLQAQRLDSIGVLASGIAHDFNNILHGIMVQSTLAIKRLDDEHPALENVQKAYQATQRAADLTHRLLSYAGRGNFEVHHVDLNDLISETLQLISSTIRSDVTIETEMVSTPLMIEADSGQIQQILLNLIMNAGEAIRARGKVAVRSKRFQLSPSKQINPVIQNGETPRQLSRQAVYALIEVEDDGCGMDEDTISKIFDPFFTTKELGHGLGLAVALGVIRTHNGMIQVESRQNTGTKFSVFFPLIEEPIKTEAIQTVQESDHSIPGEPTILIVDDDPNVCETLDSALEFLGCKVICASHGLEGVQKYGTYEGDIDLVLIDFHMPGMDGKETFMHMMKLNPALKCVFSSGFALDKTRKEIGYGNGRIDYLQKPYDLQTLKNTISHILDS